MVMVRRKQFEQAAAPLAAKMGTTNSSSQRERAASVGAGHNVARLRYHRFSFAFF
jgi:hypothetical protein